MKKRMIAIAAVIAVAATMFAGCGNKQAMEETTETAAVVSEAAEEQIEVSEEQPEDASVDAEEVEETAEADSQYATLDVDSMSFEWTEDTELVFLEYYEDWVITKEFEHDCWYISYLYPDAQDPTNYNEDDAYQKVTMLNPDNGLFPRVQKNVDTYFSNNYVTMYNKIGDINEGDCWTLWMRAFYMDGTSKYVMCLSEEDEALHVRRMDGEEVIEEYDAETSLKLAQKIIKSLLPFVTIE